MGKGSKKWLQRRQERLKEEVRVPREARREIRRAKAEFQRSSKGSGLTPKQASQIALGGIPPEVAPLQAQEGHAHRGACTPV